MVPVERGDLAQRREQLRHRLESPVGLLLQALLDDLLELRGGPRRGRRLVHGRRDLVEVGVEDLHGVAVERRVARDHGVQEDADGVDVGPVIDLLVAIEGLRRRVSGRAEELAREGDLRRLAAELHEPEVEDLGEVRVVVPLHQQDVRGLQIPVDDPLAVGLPEALAHLLGYVDRPLGRHLPLVPQHGADVVALQVLHDDEQDAVVGLAEVEDGDRVGVGEPRRRGRLAQEPTLEVGIVVDAVGGLEDLDGHAPTQGALHRGVDLAHSAAPEHPLDLVAPREQLPRARHHRIDRRHAADGVREHAPRGAGIVLGHLLLE